jgi:hypothetical protein
MSETGIIAALAAALPKMEGAKKDRQNPHFKANYATLGSVIDALEPLKDHGLWFLQISHERDNGACFETFAIHGPSNSQMSMGTMFVPADKHNAQGFGSAQSYCRRYGLMAAFGLAAEDDDGNAASQSAKPAQQRQQAKPAEAIDATQWGIIADLIGQTNTDAGAFCEHYGIAAVKNLPADKFATARRQLNAKLAKIAAEMEAAKGQSLAEELGDEIKF